ncbi:MAG: LacI family DNA-binding transcriptional regulator [Verrucomicrobiota bacterium]
MPPTRITQKDIARAAGVTQATVSLCLRNHPSVSAETCTLIQSVARRLGYVPDPYLSGLSAYRKGLRPAEIHANLAWLSNDRAGESWRDSVAFTHYHLGASERARQLGYRLEEHCLQAAGMTPARLENILHARNIGGLLVVPQPRANATLDFCFDRFSAIAFGYTLVRPQLHLVAHHHFRSMETAFRKLLSLGYQRPGLALAVESDQRADNNWSAAFWSEQRHLPARRRVPMLLGEPLDKTTFLSWFRRHQPDVVLTIWPKVHRWLTDAGVAVPADTGFALLSVPADDTRFSGMSENPRVIGAKAVETLVDLIHRGERGPPVPHLSLLVQGAWIDGKTVTVRT